MKKLIISLFTIATLNCFAAPVTNYLLSAATTTNLIDAKIAAHLASAPHVDWGDSEMTVLETNIASLAIGDDCPVVTNTIANNTVEFYQVEIFLTFTNIDTNFQLIYELDNVMVVCEADGKTSITDFDSDSLSQWNTMSTDSIYVYTNAPNYLNSYVISVKNNTDPTAYMATNGSKLKLRMQKKFAYDTN